jgi:hypothetical protein
LIASSIKSSTDYTDYTDYTDAPVARAGFAGACMNTGTVRNESANHIRLISHGPRVHAAAAGRGRPAIASVKSVKSVENFIRGIRRSI